MGYFGSFRKIFRRAGTNAQKASDDLVALSRNYNPPGGRVNLGNLFAPQRISVRDGQLFVGRLSAVEFDRFARLGDVTNSFRRALPDLVEGNVAVLGTLTTYAKQASRTLPDLPVTSQVTKVSNLRKKLGVASTAKITTADQLAEVVASNRDLVRAVERKARTVNRLRVIKFVGSSIAIAAGVTVTAAFLYEVAARIALRSTGCFMYRGGVGTNLRKCKLTKISCSSATSELPEGISACVQTSDLPAELFSGTDCAPPNDTAQCVHCDPLETNPENIGWTYGDKLPEDVILRCESKDALDILGDILDDVIDGIGDIIQNPIGALGGCFCCVLVWVIVIAVVLVGLIFVWRKVGVVGGSSNVISIQPMR